jgi:hypothetical protein
LGWTERAGVEFKSKTKLILINYLGALGSVYFLKRGPWDWRGFFTCRGFTR